MAWTTPVIHSVGDVLTASDWNISSNDLSFLSGSDGVVVDTNETTSSASYADLATTGPAVTVTTGANAIVMCGGQLKSSAPATATAYMGFAISGSTTLAASDTYAARTDYGWVSCQAIVQMGSLTAGSNTFTAKYKSSTGTANFQHRWITVIPLP